MNSPLKPPSRKPEYVGSPKAYENYIKPRPRNKKHQESGNDDDKQNHCRILSFREESANVNHVYHQRSFKQLRSHN
jgi:hypothetical protein